MEDIKDFEQHRKLMINNLANNDAELFTDIEMLEIFLYDMLPGKDTRKIAKTLLNKFGSLSKVVMATSSELVKVDGIDSETANRINIFAKIARYYIEDLRKCTKRIYDTHSAINELRPMFTGRTNEYFAVMLLSARAEVLFQDIIYEGSISQVPIYIRDIVSLCIHYNADTIIIAHNHTSGNPTPSKYDIVATKEIQFALMGIHVNLDDHIIFTNKDFTSFKRSGWLSDISYATDEFRNQMLKSAIRSEKELGL